MILQDFSSFMATRTTSDIPLLAFASDAFRPYWSNLPGPAISPDAIQKIQDAARTTVDAMERESNSYWGLDTGLERRKESWSCFLNTLPEVSKAILFRLRAIVMQMASIPSDERNFSRLLEAIYDLITSGRYANEAGFDAKSLAWVRNAYESAEMCNQTLDDLLQPWIESQTPWDVRLKEFTTGEPMTLWTALNESQKGQTLMPPFIENLWKNTPSTQEYCDVIDMLQKLFELTTADAATVHFPTLPCHDRYPEMPQPSATASLP